MLIDILFIKAVFTEKTPKHKNIGSQTLKLFLSVGVLSSKPLQIPQILWQSTRLDVTPSLLKADLLFLIKTYYCVSCLEQGTANK